MKAIGLVATLLASGPTLAANLSEEDTPPIVLSGSFNTFVPTDNNGHVRSVNVGIGAQFTQFERLSLRVALGLDPGLIPDGAPAVLPWAAMLEYQYRLGLAERIDGVLICAGGFSVSVGDGKESNSNLVIPYGRLGVGMEALLMRNKEGREITFTPQMGIMPAYTRDDDPLSILAFHVGFDLGVILPGVSR